MNKRYKKIGIFLLCYLIFDCSQLISTLGHRPKKTVFVKKVFEIILRVNLLLKKKQKIKC